MSEEQTFQFSADTTIKCPLCGSEKIKYQHCKIFCIRCGQLVMSCNETV